MPATMSTVTAITKEIYAGKIVAQLQDETVALKRIERTSDGVSSDVGGKYVTFPLRIQRNNGIGYRNEMEALPAAGNQGFTSERIGLKYGYGRLRLSGQTMELAESNPQAFSSTLDLEMGGLKDDILKDTNRIVYGNTTGVIATVVTSASAGTLTVDSLTNIQDAEFIDIVTTAGVVHGAARNILTIVPATNTITYDGSDVHAAVVAGDILIRSGNYGREPNGWGSIVSATGALFNVDPAVVRQWASTVDSNAGTLRPLSEGLMIKMTDVIRQQGGKTTAIFTSLGVRRAYFNLLSQQRRFVDTKEFSGGITGLAFSNGTEIPVVEDPDAPTNIMHFIQEDTFKVYRSKDWSWLNKDGEIWKWLNGFDAYEAVLHQYWEFGCNRRNANGKIVDLTEG